MRPSCPDARAGQFCRMFILRHGQSEFNRIFSETRRDPGIEDPRLTPLGHRQAAHAAAALADRGITRILASPYTRALQTALPLAERTFLPLEVTDRVREHVAFACDIGSPRSVLEREWPGCDFSALPEIWWAERHETSDEVRARAVAFRDWIASEPASSTTAIVCHWGFTLALTGRGLENGEWLELDRDFVVRDGVPGAALPAAP